MLVQMRKERERVKEIKGEAWKKNWCYGFMRGFCKEGDRCRWKHPMDQVAPWVVERDEEHLERDEVVEERGIEIEEGENDLVADIPEERPVRVEA